MSLIYLDNNATTKPDQKVISAMTEMMQSAWGNPSSIHRAGQAARRQVDLSREIVCDLIGCEDRELIFTSGGTEAANLAILGLLEAKKRKKILITSRLEHSSVRDLAEKLEKQGTSVIWLKNDNNGLIDLNCLQEILKKRCDEIALASIMWVNNETGVIQPITQIGEICQGFGVTFHTDATQWVGKMPTDLSNLPIDLLSFAAHKFHGPLGAGGLFIRRGQRIEPQSIGGGHERGLRAGTEDVAAIVGMAVAAKLATNWLQTDGRERIASMRSTFEKRIINASESASINGYDSPRMWDVTNIGFAMLEAEAILMMLSEQGVCASAGAACSSGSIEPSAVLLAMGVDPSSAFGSLRFSLSRDTTEDELHRATDIIIDVESKLRKSLASV